MGSLTLDLRRLALVAAADQLAGSLERDRLTRDATSAEISRRSDALKSALLDSVSHDLRTPLASIRAAAGTLMDPEVQWPDDQRRAIAASIDQEAEWLNRLVTNLLDMSRIEAGELKPSPGLFELLDLVDQAIARSRRPDGHPARPPRGVDGDPGPLRARPRGRQGDSARPGRGRLRDQTVRDVGAPGPPDPERQ